MSLLEHQHRCGLPDTDRMYPILGVTTIAVHQQGLFKDVAIALGAQQYADEVDHRSAVLSAVLEPLLIIFIGVFVALILIAMYLPLFDLSTTIG